MDSTSIVNHLLYDAFGRVTDETNSAVDSLFLFTARPFDSDSQLQNNLNHWYDPAVGRWLSEDPIGFEAEHINLYRYALNAPIIFVDPFGLTGENKITGACHISIYAGHGIWPAPWNKEDPAVGKFRRSHDVQNADIVTGCGNYLGYVGCEGSKLNAGVAKNRELPGMPPMDGRVGSQDMLGLVQQALTAARALQKKLCENRKKFCDDGRPERYRCGADMQRCNSVTIQVSCDDDMEVMMKKGIYRKRLGPNGAIVVTWPIPGLPNAESRLICGLSETMDCLEQMEF